MKKLLLVCLLSVFTFIGNAQNRINYKVIVKDDLGNVLSNQNIGVRFSIILDGGSPLYQETHSIDTDTNGLLIASIGTGTPTIGTYADLTWTFGYSLKVEFDTGGGYIDMGTSLMQFVPYAQTADRALTAQSAQTAQTAQNVGLELFGGGYRLAGSTNNSIGSGAVDLSLSGDGFGAVGGRSFAVGRDAYAADQFATAIGFGAKALGRNSVAIGQDALANVNSSFSFGNNTLSNSLYCTVLGRLNIGYDNSIFEIGQGTGNSTSGFNRANLFTVFKTGNVHIPIGPDTGLGTTSNGHLLLGQANGVNISIDNNEIMARDNGAAADLNLQIEGGNVKIGGEIQVNESGSNVAMRVEGDEAIWYNGTYFSWGFGGSANYFADNIGINDITPNARLHINASDDVALNTTNNGLLLLGSNFAKNIAIDNNEIMARDNGAASELRLQENGGNVLVGGAIVQTSDQRLKKDIEDLEYGLSEIIQLLPKAYNWKNREDREHKSLGLLAQDVQFIIPDVVGQNEDSDLLHVNYVELIPVLINAIKEQQKIIQSQKERHNLQNEELAELKSGYNELLQRVKKLETNNSN